MLPNHLEKIVFHTILEHREYLNVTKPEFFESQYYSDLFKIATIFVNKYNKTPTQQQMLELIKISNLHEITREFLDALYDYKKELYDPEWLEESIEAWLEFKQLDKSMENAITYLKTTKISVENIRNVSENVKDIINSGTNTDFKFDEGLDFFDPESHIQPTADTFSTGFPYIDLVLGGGWYTKSLFVICGQQKIGKSIWLANFTSNSIRLGYNTAVISLEMSDRKFIKRIGANLLGISMSEYSQLANDNDLIRKKLDLIGMEDFKTPGKLFVKEFPTSAASIKDVERWLLKMEQLKGIKFKTVYIDYINILMNWRNPNSENTYMKVKQIAEDMRAMAIRNNWAVISCTQIGRSAFNSTNTGIENVAESSGLGATVDAMFGIIQDELMLANRQYILKTMLNRDEGYKETSKQFNIDYSYMRINETLDPIIQNNL